MVAESAVIISRKHFRPYKCGLSSLQHLKVIPSATLMSQDKRARYISEERLLNLHILPHVPRAIVPPPLPQTRPGVEISHPPFLQTL